MENDYITPMADSAPTLADTGGYTNGSDLLVEIDGKCVGHCTSHALNYNSETKQHAVKAPATETTTGIDLFSQTTVSALSIGITFEGLVHDSEAEMSVGSLKSKWRAAKPVTVKAFKRGGEPSLVCEMVITKLTETAPAQDDTTYSGELANCGAPSVFNP